MNEGATISIPVDAATKASAETINIFLRKAVMEGDLPFDMGQPCYNAETDAAISETRAIMSGKIPAKRYPSARALFDELDAEEE